MSPLAVRAAPTAVADSWKRSRISPAANPAKAAGTVAAATTSAVRRAAASPRPVIPRINQAMSLR